MTQPQIDRDERTLVERFVRTRDEASFRLLYRRHTPALYGLALRLLERCQGDAEDAVQDAWIRAASRLPSFRWDSALRTWLSSIVVNCCRERRRDRWRMVDDEGDAAESRGEEPPALELSIDLDRAIARLPPGCRAVFVLHDIEGRTHREIAALLEIGEGTSKSQLSYARRQLRARLGDQGTERP